MAVATAATSVVAEVDVRTENTWLREKWASIIETATGVDKSTRNTETRWLAPCGRRTGPGLAKGCRSDMKLENLLKEQHCKFADLER